MRILSTLISAVGSSLGILGQLGSANLYDQISELNYQADLSNANAQRSSTLTGLRLDRIGIGIQKTAAQTNLRLALAETEAQRRNAERLRSFAEAKTSTSRESIRRKMRTFDEFRSSQRAAVAASGVTASGSALEVMAESAAQFRLAVQDEHDQANFDRNATLDQATMMELDSNRGAVRARADFGISQRGARLSSAAIRLGRLGAQTAFQSARMQAEIRRMSGADQAQGQRLGAVSTALSGVGGFIDNKFTSNYLGMGKVPSAYAKQVGGGIFRP